MNIYLYLNWTRADDHLPNIFATTHNFFLSQISPDIAFDFLTKYEQTHFPNHLSSYYKLSRPMNDEIVSRTFINRRSKKETIFFCVKTLVT